ncbi:hypothetical protein ADIMK_4193 [Marinobacterium lacunae]|uniref:DUF2789 domain-containing protein n=1 Tax=Marinobacterium lacunae TaxID=1232683 RepID=A0A081FT81_9GAMM|nr:DUF2789 domain-containing protein [Marinobacterium lacunae]KEA61736.1 hypothetical protein ADIMK_4193 [Marinobacterium lacunae]MBR9883985.1 DUF2789 domain-containing protein [Oceanospirillales bacterium]
MDTSAHTLNTLFEQLGLPSSSTEIERFIETHRLFTQEIPLHQASFWSSSQADFLKDAIYSDSDWAEVVDELNALLRSTH